MAARGARAAPAMPVVGFLNPGTAGAFSHLTDALRRGLAETGYVVNQNVAIEYRWAEAIMTGCRSWRPNSFVGVSR